jgi:hypothetical protein
MTTLANLTVKQGDTYTKVLTVTDDDGVAINLTGSTLTFHLRAQGSATDAITPAPTLTLTTPLSGIATLTLTAAQTAALTARATMLYEIECVDALSNVTTPVEGLVYVSGDRG